LSMRSTLVFLKPPLPPRPTLFPYTTLFRSQATTNQNVKKRPACSELRWAYCNHKATYFASYLTGGDCVPDDQNTWPYGYSMPIAVQIGRAVQQECRDRSRMPSSA